MNLNKWNIIFSGSAMVGIKKRKINIINFLALLSFRLRMNARKLSRFWDLNNWKNLSRWRFLGKQTG